MNILLIVNTSPWASTRANTALRFLRAAQAEGHVCPAVFFQGDGVYNAIAGRQSDAGAENLFEAFSANARAHDIDLMLCSGAAARRLSAETAGEIRHPWREAGLAEWIVLMEDSDRVIGF